MIDNVHAQSAGNRFWKTTTWCSGVDPPSPITEPAAITNDGWLYLWGDNSEKQLCNEFENDYTYNPIIIDELQRVVNVTLGSSSTFIQTEVNE